MRKISRIDIVGQNGGEGTHYKDKREGQEHYDMSHLVKCVGHGCTKKSVCARYVEGDSKPHTMFAKTPQLLPYGRGCQFFIVKGSE